MVKALLLAAALGSLAPPLFAQATTAPGSTQPKTTPPGTNQPPANPNMGSPNSDPANPNMTKPVKPSTPPDARSQPPGRQFQDLDTDRNGTISEQEYGSILGGPSQAFGSVDSNRDGRVSEDEYAKWLKTQPDRTSRSGPSPGSTSSRDGSDSMRP